MTANRLRISRPAFSRPMGKVATELTGVQVDVAPFETWHGLPQLHDGIWVFASLLHVAVPLADVPRAVDR